jgi:hypothetical protein
MMNLRESAREWVQIVRGEFIEMPCLRLTRTQVMRLWGFDEPMCTMVLNLLLEQRFLDVTADGHYLRGGSVPSTSAPAVQRPVVLGFACEATPADMTVQSA